MSGWLGKADGCIQTLCCDQFKVWIDQRENAWNRLSTKGGRKWQCARGSAGEVTCAHWLARNQGRWWRHNTWVLLLGGFCNSVDASRYACTRPLNLCVLQCRLNSVLFHPLDAFEWAASGALFSSILLCGRPASHDRLQSLHLDMAAFAEVSMPKQRPDNQYSIEPARSDRRRLLRVTIVKRTSDVGDRSIRRVRSI